MASEAQCLEAAFGKLSPDERPLIRVAGANWERASELAREVVRMGVSGLMSFGVAGGLHPSYGMGDILVPSVVQNEAGEKIQIDDRWQQALDELYGATGNLWSGPMLTVDRVLALAEEKAEAYRETQAVGVDMESYPVAEVAREMELPFAVLRVVFDAADRDLPELSLRVINQDGTINPGRVVGELLRNPRELGPIISVGIKAGNAKRKMKAMALGGLPFFGLL